MLPKEKPFTGSFCESFQRNREDLRILFGNLTVVKTCVFETSFYETLRMKDMRAKWYLECGSESVG